MEVYVHMSAQETPPSPRAPAGSKSVTHPLCSFRRSSPLARAVDEVNIARPGPFGSPVTTETARSGGGYGRHHLVVFRIHVVSFRFRGWGVLLR